MSARAECKPRLYREHGTIVGIIVIVNPQRSYKKLIAYFERFEILFPIIFPILVFANGEVYFIWYIFCLQPLAEIRNRLARIFVFGNIYVDKALCTVFFQQLFINEVDICNLPGFLFEISVILDVYSVGNGHIGNCRRLINVIGVYLK